MSIRRPTLAAMALLVAMAGCRDTTSPDKPVVVTLSEDAQQSPDITDTPNGPRIDCTFHVTARATGDGSATWLDARTIWFIGPDRVSPVDTTSNSASEVQGAFGGSSISGGQTQQTTWHLYAGAPFEANLGFGYSVAGAAPSYATTHITCGPTPQGAVVPTVTQISVPNTSGDLAVGDAVSVTYQASSSSGIWMTVVDVTGAFKSEQVFGEHMATSVNRTVKFAVPNGAVPGVPITLSVRAFNAALVGTAKSLETQLKFADKVPPTISSVSVLGRDRLVGQYAVGDTISLFATANDDNALGWLVYQIGPPANVRDSVPATPGATLQSWVIKAVVQQGWVGTPIVSMYSRDAGGLTSQTVSSTQDSIRFYPIVNRPTTPALTLSPTVGMNDLAYDAKRDRMYVGLANDNHVTVFSPSTMTVQTPIALPGAVAGMDLSLSGDSLLVAVPSANVVSVVNLNDPTAPLGSIKLSVLDTTAQFFGIPVAPSGLRVMANGKMIVMLSDYTMHYDQSVEVDLTTGAQRILTDARGLTTATPCWTVCMDRTPDRSRLYVMTGICASHYDTSTDTFIMCHGGIGTDFAGLTFDASNTYLTRGSYVLDANMNTLWWMDLPNHQTACAAISPDDANIYICAGKAMTTMRFADKVMLERVPIPATAQRMFVSPGGDWLLAFERVSAARVTRIDLR